MAFMDFKTVSVTPNCKASSNKVIDELKRVWKEKFAAQYRSYYGINFKKLRHTKKIQIQDSRCPGQNSNQVPADYKCVMLPLR